MGGSGVNGVEIEAFANDNPIIHAIVVLKSEVNRLVTVFIIPRPIDAFDVPKFSPTKDRISVIYKNNDLW